jgi:predicted membrane protein
MGTASAAFVQGGLAVAPDEMSSSQRTRSVAAAPSGFAVAVAFAVIGAALLRRDHFGSQTDTIYPWWVWVLVVVGVCAGLVSGVGPRAGARVARIAPAIAAIAAGQLSGTGFVAFKHWEPASGMGGAYGTHLGELKRMAVVIGITGLVAVVLSLGQLVADGDLPYRAPRPLRVLCCVAGGLVVVGVPSIIAALNGDMRDLTSWGAMGLIYAGPWGVALIAVGWLARPTAIAALATVSLGACLALVGPQMTDLVFGNPAPAFATALIATVLVFAALVRQPPDRRQAPPVMAQ